MAISLKDRIYEEKLLEIYSQKSSILEVLKCAVAQEKHYRKGAFLNSDTVHISARCDDNSGLWEVCIAVDHGKVYYTCHDVNANNISILSVPSDKYIKDRENLTEAERQTIQIQASTALEIDLKDVRTLRKAKDLFKTDYVLKNIPLYHLDHDNAARFLIWHIKAYKKVFMDYIKTYGFLWEGTSFKNSMSLARALVERGLISEDYFFFPEYDSVDSDKGVVNV